jgi:hypothetical protein
MNLADSALPQTTDRSSSRTNLSCGELSRLEVSIFSTLNNNLRSLDFSKVLLDVATIADE